MIDILMALYPIFLSLLVGMIVGRFGSEQLSCRIVKLLSPFIWVLLFAIGYKFGLVVENLQNIVDVIKLALIFSIGCSFFVGIGIYLLYPQSIKKQKNKVSLLSIWHIIKECAFALLAIVLGDVLAQGLVYLGWNTSFMPSSNTFLYLLLFIIGVDIINAPFSFKTIHKPLLLMPIAILITSSLGGMLLAWMMNLTLQQGLVLAGGFGWFSLSGAMVTAEWGEFYGAIAVLTDLFREIIAIVVLFFMGALYPNPSIAIAGATAMDTTLPIIKKAAGNHAIALAIYIGAVLSLIVPFWLAFLLSGF
ncbi:lysine exporter LysO family protein [Pelistega sp. NLN82]|uniref:Lysine exporter LysO family protein n=1 Tax=Pelistega ratti TaxID=2652177 RepID=A0A6L9Y557_9BURK|nr:lysine exporter LysO family protein [Pelistega ratti]NEN75541.1 lysine exporter LysO family protein [Pelistega ratti]